MDAWLKKPPPPLPCWHLMGLRSSVQTYAARETRKACSGASTRSSRSTTARHAHRVGCPTTLVQRPCGPTWCFMGRFCSSADCGDAPCTAEGDHGPLRHRKSLLRRRSLRWGRAVARKLRVGSHVSDTNGVAPRPGVCWQTMARNVETASGRSDAGHHGVDSTPALRFVLAPGFRPDGLFADLLPRLHSRRTTRP